MTIQDLTAALIRSLTVGLLFTIAPPLAWAQVEEPAASSYINFRIQTLKPGKLAEWEQLRQEQSDGNRKAGTAFYHVYQSLRGPSDTFLIVSPATAIGEPEIPFASPSPSAVPHSWFNAISGTLDSQMVVTLQIDS